MLARDVDPADRDEALDQMRAQEQHAQVRWQEFHAQCQDYGTEFGWPTALNCLASAMRHEEQARGSDERPVGATEPRLEFDAPEPDSV